MMKTVATDGESTVPVIPATVPVAVAPLNASVKVNDSKPSIIVSESSWYVIVALDSPEGKSSVLVLAVV